jgi:hypothetical protein
MITGLGGLARRRVSFLWAIGATLALGGVLFGVPPLASRGTDPAQPDPVAPSVRAEQAVQLSEAEPVSPSPNETPSSNAAFVSGPDLVLGNIYFCEELGREGSLGSGTIGMSCWTTACNKGDQDIDWVALPSISHPEISVNMFRLRKLDGSDRMQQLGQSWLKDGFGTENRDDCGFGCTGGDFSHDGPGCSDTYAASQFVPCDLGPRTMINPYTGVMPFGLSTGPGAECPSTYPSEDHRDHVHDQISHRLQVKDVDLSPPLNVGARYFTEAQYIATNEFTQGNGNQNNNVSHRQVLVDGGGGCNSVFLFTDYGETVSEEPAVTAWPGASQTLIEPAPLVDGRAFLAYKVTSLGNVWRYEYALYNMNMDRAIGSLSVPVPAGVAVTHTGFYAPLNHAPEPHADPITNTTWTVSTTGGAVTWSTDPFGVDPFANAVRWGTMYNFWFEASSPPQAADATVGLFKTGGTVAAATLAPAGVIDCNNNGIADRCDINCLLSGCSVPGCGTKADCDANGVPDDCEPDCNHNGVADRCDIASALSLDCDADAVPDECEPFVDCNGNTIRDDCEVYADPTLDRNSNGIPDTCESLTGATLYVDGSAPAGTADGTAARPFHRIQEGIDAAHEGDTVVVLDGVYRGFQNVDLSFYGKVLTLRSQNGPANCVVDLQGAFRFTFFRAGEGLATRVNGFHITNIPSGGQFTPPAILAWSSPTISNCVFTGAGPSAKGVRLQSGSRAALDHCRFTGLLFGIDCQTCRAVVSNCLFAGGSTALTVTGGNFSQDCAGSSSPRIINSTISGAATGISTLSGAFPYVDNTIVWGNSSTQIVPGNQITVSYSDVQGGWLGIGNIDANPLFVNAGGGDYRLANGSPCIDAGNNAVASLPATDFDGGPRLFDDPATADTGAGTPPIIDIGADEWTDCNDNGIEDSVEVDQNPALDCNRNRVPDECEPFQDCNNNSVRDICDISVGTSQDCNANSIPDSCEIAQQTSQDCNSNNIPDECEADCNRNHVPDQCDITAGTSQDCDGDGVPDECETFQDCNNNGILDACDIAAHTSDDLNGNRIPDECEPSTPQSEPGGVNKNRALSVSVPAPATSGPGPVTALRVRMIELQNPIPPNAPCCPPRDLSAFEAGTCSAAGEAGGCARWVGKPATFYESQGPPLAGPYRAARLQCTPVYIDWTAEGLVHVVGAEIVPSSTLEVQNLASACLGSEATCPFVSAPLTIKTARHGDVAAVYNPPGTTTQPDAIDVTQLVNKFKSVLGSPSKAVTQLQPNVPELNADVNAIDIVAVVDAVKGRAYPFAGPCPCPSLMTCRHFPCATPAVCVALPATSGGGPGAMCVKTCVGSTNDGEPCINDAHCPGGGTGSCGNGGATPGFCRDACGRCTP